jgi:hypothetical protein
MATATKPVNETCFMLTNESAIQEGRRIMGVTGQTRGDFIPTRIEIILKNINGIVDYPVINVGTNFEPYDNIGTYIQSDTGMLLAPKDVLIDNFYPSLGLAKHIPPMTSIFLNVWTCANGLQFDFDVRLTGHYLDN